MKKLRQLTAILLCISGVCFAESVYDIPEAVWIEEASGKKSKVFAYIDHPMPTSVAHPAAVTYAFSGGRFGDNLIAYFHAKWISMKFGMPFIYRPFHLSDRLALDFRDSTYGGYYLYDTIWPVLDMSEIDPKAQNIIYVIEYFPEFKPELSLPQMKGVFNYDVDWFDPNFRDEVLACMQPTCDVDLIWPPEGYVSVALHVRRGGAFESYEVGLKNEPLKFPPDSFYINEIARVAEIHEGQPLYVHIFTDDEHPELIAKKYQEALSDIPLVFNWEISPSHSDPVQIFRDFYSMGNFDCLIHPGSNFSIMAGIIGSNIIDIVPIRFFRKGTEPVIDLVEIRTRLPLMHAL